VGVVDDGPMIPNARNGVVIKCTILANIPRCFRPRRSYMCVNVQQCRCRVVKINYLDRDEI
jgi:hypothetical protein